MPVRDRTLTWLPATPSVMAPLMTFTPAPAEEYNCRVLGPTVVLLMPPVQVRTLVATVLLLASETLPA